MAAWGSTWLNKRQIERLEQRVASMRTLTRELVIKDREHIAIVQQHPKFYKQQLWHLYVPNDSLGLHLMTRDIPPTALKVTAKHAGPVPVAHLTSGRHVVEFQSEAEEDQWITQVFVDDKPVITVREPAEWKSHGGYRTSYCAKQADFPADRPAVLFHGILSVPTSKMSSKPPAGISNGIALWIEEVSSQDNP